MEGVGRQIRRRAEELRAQGARLRGTADLLLTRVVEEPWEGRAAESLRQRIRDRARRLSEVADAHDRAAAALDRHADAVEGGGDGGVESRAPAW